MKTPGNDEVTVARRKHKGSIPKLIRVTYILRCCRFASYRRDFSLRELKDKTLLNAVRTPIMADSAAKILVAFRGTRSRCSSPTEWNRVQTPRENDNYELFYLIVHSIIKIIREVYEAHETKLLTN